MVLKRLFPILLVAVFLIEGTFGQAQDAKTRFEMLNHSVFEMLFEE